MIEGPSGCNEVELIFYVQVNPTTYIQTDTTICEGQNYMGLETSGTYELDSFDPVTGCLVVENVNLVVLPLSDPDCITSTKETQNQAFNIFPNPTQNRLFIESKLIMNSITVYNQSGIIVKIESDLSTDSHSLDLISNQEGLYFLKVNTDSGSHIQKFIIHR